MVDDTAVEEPHEDDPAEDQTVADVSVVDGPVVDDPVLDGPVLDGPFVDDPVVEEIADETVREDIGHEESLAIVDPDVLAETLESETGSAAPALAIVDPDVLAETLESETGSAAPALALRGVVKEFGDTRAVDAIDLTIPAGSFFGLVGPNGAGKTTTLSMIAGLLRPDSGTIEVCGVDAATDPSRAKRLIGVLPDRLRTFDRLTGRQLLYYYGVLRGLSSSVVQSRISDLARAFDLVDALGRVVSDYSAGMTKKVMLAGAMIHSPRVLVLDEPFESLDPASSQVILDILETYVAHGGTVVLSSHGMALVERVCTRVAVLVEGEVLATGTVDEVRGEMTLEQRFVELSGGVDDAEGLEWLHTFSD
ncbi:MULTISPECIES: ABC transporter ATP-binding protein [unclassified Microbacterium]|uniref:ABC transporter ATP-binding protein n=1 Tax=unclassified Microbacterium TaxID=2609290 RepID=UPI001E4B27B7|nr:MULTISPECIES: ABC transporter ATP-binding protein [unclassified Microbacterium]